MQMYLSKQMEICEQIDAAQSTLWKLKNNTSCNGDNLDEVEEILETARQKLQEKPVSITLSDFAAFVSKVAEEQKDSLFILSEVVPDLENSQIVMKFCYTDVYGVKHNSGIAFNISTKRIKATWLEQSNK